MPPEVGDPCAFLCTAQLLCVATGGQEQGRKSTSGAVPTGLCRPRADGHAGGSEYLTAQGLILNGTVDADTLRGVNNYSNTLIGGGGNDALYGANLADSIDGGAGADTIFAGAGDDVVTGGDGNDTLYGGDGNDILDGGSGDDVIDGGRGADTLIGGAGNDILGGVVNSEDSGYYNSSSYPYGYFSPIAGNIYIGGAGNDLLRGTSMADTYMFNAGDGQDTIQEVEVNGQPTGQADAIRFGQGIAKADVLVSRVGNDLVLTNTTTIGAANGPDKITIKSWYTTASSTANQIEQVWFDGDASPSWDAQYLTTQGLTVQGSANGETLTGLASYANVLYGNGGADTLNGGSQNDLLVGGTGNDALYGGAGSDVYRWAAGDGLDTVSDTSGAADQLELTGIDLALVHYWRQGNDLLIDAGVATEGVLVKNQFASGGANMLENFYINGTCTSAANMALMAVSR